MELINFLALIFMVLLLGAFVCIAGIVFEKKGFTKRQERLGVTVSVLMATTLFVGISLGLFWLEFNSPETSYYVAAAPVVFFILLFSVPLIIRKVMLSRMS